jgi:hypothetical protein
MQMGVYRGAATQKVLILLGPALHAQSHFINTLKEDHFDGGEISGHVWERENGW